LITGGLLAWAADFLFIYVFTAIACARGYAGYTVLGAGIVPLASAVSTLLALGATAWMVVVAQRWERTAGGDDVFAARAAPIIAALAVIAIVQTALPGILVLGTCS
jgi:hypothetical protein